MRLRRPVLLGLLLFLGTTALAQDRTAPGDEAQAKYIALTFDDGPDEEATPALLDVLKRHGARATFFPMGDRIAANRQILRRMATEGHAIGNHTLTHRRLTSLPAQTARSEIEGVNALVEQITGERPVVFRPPYADMDGEIVEIARANGLAIILWSIYPEQLGYLAGAEGISDRIISTARDGDIVFMHDTSQRAVEATEGAIETLSRNGFVFVTVPELIARRGGLAAGQIYRTAIGGSGPD